MRFPACTHTWNAWLMRYWASLTRSCVAPRATMFPGLDPPVPSLTPVTVNDEGIMLDTFRAAIALAVAWAVVEIVDALVVASAGFSVPLASLSRSEERLGKNTTRSGGTASRSAGNVARSFAA